MLEIKSVKLILNFTKDGQEYTIEQEITDFQDISVRIPSKDKTKEFIQKAKKIHGNKYDYSKVNYINNKTKVCIICHEKDENGIEHGKFWQRPNDHISSKAGCPKCRGSHLYTKEEFVNKANYIHNNKYDYSLVKYSGNKNHVTIICPIHGEFKQRPDKHLRGQGCPKCNKSHGETIVERYLLNNKFEYYSQFEIPIDTTINPTGKAYIDFYLPKYNLFIEYNGEQHYINRTHFGNTFNDFERQTKRDQFVRDYCKKENIRLLEIPYTEKSIEGCINNFINNIND